MSAKVKIALSFFFLIGIKSAFSQNQQTRLIQTINLDQNKVLAYEKFPEFKYNITPGAWDNIKVNNPMLYKKELWYYTESFYIKKDSLNEGISLEPGMIDISRFEKERLQNTEHTVVLPGFKDVMVLLPKDKLIYKPE